VSWVICRVGTAFAYRTCAGGLLTMAGGYCRWRGRGECGEGLSVTAGGGRLGRRIREALPVVAMW
jgi:hypothetical protein